MKRLFIAAALTIAAASPALAADVGVSISIGNPGFYGRIDIGNYPPPRLIYQEPRLIQRVVPREPIYLHVAPGHAKNWRKYCRKYDACGERVYFVQDSWYNQVYVPSYQERNDDHHDEHEKDEHEKDKHEKDKHEKKDRRGD